MCLWESYNKKKYFFFASLKSMKKRDRPGSISQGYGSRDPDPHQNLTDPQHWYKTVTLAGSLGGRAGGERIRGLGAATGLVFAASGLTKTIFKDVCPVKKSKECLRGSFFLHREETSKV